MEEEQEVFNLREEHLVGKLIYAPKAHLTIEEITAPIEKDILILSAEDLASKEFRILDNIFPVLANKVTSYEGQPVLAVFGPNTETVESFSSEIQIKYSEFEPEREIQAFDASQHTSGRIEDYFNENYKVFSSEFDIESNLSAATENRIQATIFNSRLYIKLSTQWPTHVKNCIATELGVDKSTIVLQCNDYYAPYDQLMVLPVVGAILTAIAAVKTGKQIELPLSMISVQPHIHFEMSSALDSNGNLVAHMAKAVVNLGAYPIFTTEYCNELLAGLIPSYPLKAINIETKVFCGPTVPATFYGDLGYASALAATESHFSKLASSLNVLPTTFRAKEFELMKDQNWNLNIKEKVRRSSSYDILPLTFYDCCEHFGFNRQYSANSQRSLSKSNIIPLIQYSRGVGIACGEGVEGFSYSFPYLPYYSIFVTIKEDSSAVICVGMQLSNSVQKICKAIVTKNLGISSRNIHFENINSPTIVEMGPNTLSRSIRFIPMLLEACCEQLKDKINNANLPITVSASHDIGKQDCLFESDTAGTLAIALHVDPVSIVPVIDNIYARVQFGKILESSRVKKLLRQTILLTISEICPCAENTCEIELKIDNNPACPVGSATSLIRGLTIGAFTSALSQATGHTIYKLPITDRNMLGIINKASSEAKHDS